MSKLLPALTTPATAPDLATRTGLPLFWVICELRWLELTGRVTSERGQATAEQVARLLAGKRTVVWNVYRVRERSSP